MPNLGYCWMCGGECRCDETPVYRIKWTCDCERTIAMTNLGPCPLCGCVVRFGDDGFIACSGCDEYPGDVNLPYIHRQLSAMGELWRKKDAEKSLVDELVVALDMVVSACECGGAIAADEPATLLAARKVLEKARKHNES